MTRIQFGWSMPSGPRDKDHASTYLSDLQRGFDLIRGHYDSIWLVDHLQFGANPLMEGWTGLTYLAAQQPDFQFGHAVLCQSFRNPALLAKMATTAQFLSGGRFILGLGAGWKEDEYLSYGYDYPSPGTRVDELGESLQIIKGLWQEELTTFEGKHYQVREARCEPKPDPAPTIMVGGSKPRMLRLVARYADWWNVSWTAIAAYRDQVAELEKACGEVGRDPASLRRTWFGGCACGRTEEAAQQLMGRQMTGDSFAFIGSPAQIVEQMRPFIDLGVDYFMLGSGGFPDLTTLELLVNEVLPAVNQL